MLQPLQYQPHGHPAGPHLRRRIVKERIVCHQESQAKSNLLDANTLRKGGGWGGRGYRIGGGLKKFPAVEGPNPGCWYAPLGTLRRVCSLLVLDSRSLQGRISCSAVEQNMVHCAAATLERVIGYLMGGKSVDAWTCLDNFSNMATNKQRTKQTHKA